MVKIEATDALIVVDVQVDFCPGGALPVDGGDEVVDVLNRIRPLFQHVAMTRDWHPADHCSFASPPEFVDGSWPAHCVQGTPGAAFHPKLKRTGDEHVVDSATSPDKEAYSGFDGTDLGLWLRTGGATRIFVGGLALDFCVKCTALDGRKAGFEVVLIEDACRAIDNPPGTAEAAMEAMRAAGVATAKSEELA